MIVRNKEIYKIVAETNNLPIETVESVGSAVFNELLKCLEDPKEIAYELPKFGTFVLKFKKYENYYNSFKAKLDAGDEKAIQKKEENEQLFINTTGLINKMLQYRSDKRESKIKRYATDKPSQDNPE